jgi:Ricin-type beta-trefoil lectin domain
MRGTWGGGCGRRLLFTAVTGLLAALSVSGVATAGPPSEPVAVHRLPDAPSGQLTGLGGRCLDVAGSRSANGTAVQLYWCNGTSAQDWTFDGGTVRALGKCLDVPNSSTSNGVLVQLWDCNGTGAQQWEYSERGTLRNPHSSKCLDVPGWRNADGSRPMLWDCTAFTNQQWLLPGQASPHPFPVFITAAGAGGVDYCVIPVPGATSDDTVWILACDRQILPFATWDTDGGLLRQPNTSRCLDVAGGSGANGAAVVTAACNGNGSQLWQPFPDGSLRTMGSGKCLDLPLWTVSFPASVMIWDCTGAANQRWSL